MNPEKSLRGKTVLVVDDEKDILDTLVDILDMSRLDTASSFKEAETLLGNNSYDPAILDIMGVDGTGLLEIATK